MAVCTNEPQIQLNTKMKEIIPFKPDCSTDEELIKNTPKGVGQSAIDRNPNKQNKVFVAPKTTTDEEVQANIDKLAEFEDSVKGLETLVLPVEHFFAPGIYMRKTLLPADTFLTGKVHRHECINLILTGTCSVTTAEGTAEFVAPMTLIGQPGAKRGIYARTDSWWATVHPNPDNETDLEVLEKRYMANDFEDWQSGQHDVFNLQLTDKGEE